MYRRAIALICLTFFTCGGRVVAQPTPAPTVTAESESWYLAGEPILHDGIVYYPRGAAVFFDRDEFVRSGFYRGIPLYSRTTIEPFSMVYLPVGGGLMQPYVRPRTGELVGTIGSLSPSLPTPVPTDERRYSGMAQAAGPPTSLPGPTDIEGNPRLAAPPIDAPPVVVGSSGATGGPAVVGSSGRVVVMPVPRPVVTAARPSGVNGVFIEFENTRWYSSGSPIEFDAGAFKQIGTYHGFPVYARTADDGAIYIPTAVNVRGIVARYARR